MTEIQGHEPEIPDYIRAESGNDPELTELILERERLFSEASQLDNRIGFTAHGNNIDKAERMNVLTARIRLRKSSLGLDL